MPGTIILSRRRINGTIKWSKSFLRNLGFSLMEVRTYKYSKGIREIVKGTRLKFLKRRSNLLADLNSEPIMIQAITTNMTISIRSYTHFGLLLANRTIANSVWERAI